MKRKNAVIISAIISYIFLAIAGYQLWENFDETWIVFFSLIAGSFFDIYKRHLFNGR